MEPANENLIVVATTEDDIHEGILADALTDAQIGYVIKPFDDHVFDGITESHYGHSRILVLEENEENAKKIIGEIPSPKNA